MGFGGDGMCGVKASNSRKQSCKNRVKLPEKWRRKMITLFSDIYSPTGDIEITRDKVSIDGGGEIKDGNMYLRVHDGNQKHRYQ